MFARGSNTAAGLMLPSSYPLLPLSSSVQYNILEGQKLHLQSHTTVISHYSASETAIEKKETHTHTHSYENTISSHINMSTADNWTEIVWLKEQLLQVLCRQVLGIDSCSEGSMRLTWDLSEHIILTMDNTNRLRH